MSPAPAPGNRPPGTPNPGSPDAVSGRGPATSDPAVEEARAIVAAVHRVRDPLRIRPDSPSVLDVAARLRRLNLWAGSAAAAG